jgi:circadian clock protein KaiC
MKTKLKARLEKAPTGIEGLDDITFGGLPRGRATLVVGGPGSGKTMLSLQTIVNGARMWNEPGIFVAFEEDSNRIIANASEFGWDLEELKRKGLFFLDAQPKPDLVQSGGFDLSGMLATLAAKARAIGARRIVFDAMDRLLELLADPQAERREVYRVNEWLLEQDMTALITAKAYDAETGSADHQPMGFMQFMVDCAVSMNHAIIAGVSQRNLRVLKYRGSAFSENESPFVFGKGGIEVAGSLGLIRKLAKVTSERVSTGVMRLDTMLGGGYYRGAGVLITGSPGTSKTTLAGAFAEAACQRGEQTLFVSFDSDGAEIVRNLASVNVRLDRFLRQGLLRMVSAHTGKNSAEVHLMQIKTLVREGKARNLIIDPVSALSREGNEVTAHSVVERLMDWSKAEKLTLLCTSLLDRTKTEAESTPLQISTIADSWLHLNYLVHAGERNRALTIIKSRGTAHSNQVRELILDHSGISLTDVYSAGGEVLMGSLRLEKEQSRQAEQLRLESENNRKIAELELSEVELTGRMKALGLELAAKRAARRLLKNSESRKKSQLAKSRTMLSGMRGVDLALPLRKNGHK